MMQLSIWKKFTAAFNAAANCRTDCTWMGPSVRTGCKLAVVDSTGKVLDTVVIYPTLPQKKVKEAKEIVKN